jgi:hypothetical protein
LADKLHGGLHVAERASNASFAKGAKREFSGFGGRGPKGGAGLRTEQSQWSRETGWRGAAESPLGGSAQLVFAFGGLEAMEASGCPARVRGLYPNATLVGCSTAGEIQGVTYSQNSVALTAVAFEHTRVAVARADLASPERSSEAGAQVARALAGDGLVHVFLLSEGLQVNGSDLMRGLKSNLPPSVSITGGFAGDGDRMQRTWLWLNGEPAERIVLAVGFYGSRLKVGALATGAWGPFGPDRLITRSKGNVLFELDGRSALGVYKTYLGEHAADLPACGLMFPLMIHYRGAERCVLRALLGVNEEEQSITFAGDVPEGACARLMRGSIERLIDGTLEAARGVVDSVAEPPEFSLLVSCNGRRHVLKQRLEEELEAVQECLGPQAVLTGFYSYGEIGPSAAGEPSELHNETLTITTFSER